MTGENREHNAREELARARTCLDEARTLDAARLPYGAASRSFHQFTDTAQFANADTP